LEAATMRRASFCAMFLLFIYVVQAMAVETLHLSVTSATDHNALPVGQSATFNVQLSGLPSQWELDDLAAIVSYDSALLGTPTIFKGGIIPNPLNATDDFVSAPFPGEAGATFFTLSEDSAYHIRSNGTFFSFSAPVSKAGSGSLLFSLLDVSSPSGDLDIAGSPLSIQSVIVPEPSGFILLATAAVAAYFLRKLSSIT
jgi:hypothetical protein